MGGDLRISGFDQWMDVTIYIHVMVFTIFNIITIEEGVSLAEFLGVWGITTLVGTVIGMIITLFAYDTFNNEY